MNSTSLTPKEKEVLEAIKDLCVSGLPPDKDDILDEVTMGKRNLTDHLVSIEDKSKIGTEKIGNKKFYFVPSYDQSEIDGYNKLEEDITKAIENLNRLLGDIRDPSIDEVAEWINRDSEDELFRQIFFKVKEEKNLTKPSEDDIEHGKLDLTHKIVRCLLWKNGVLKEAKHPDFDDTNLENYYASNRKNLESVDIDIRSDGPKVTSVQFEFPKELRAFTGRRYYTRKYNEEGQDYGWLERQRNKITGVKNRIEDFLK